MTHDNYTAPTIVLKSNMEEGGVTVGGPSRLEKSVDRGTRRGRMMWMFSRWIVSVPVVQELSLRVCGLEELVVVALLLKDGRIMIGVLRDVTRRTL